MMLFIFFLVSLSIFFSTVGYGLLINNFIKFENSNYNYGLMGLLGLFLLTIISNLTHIILPHNYIHNLIIIFFGFLIFFFDKKFSFKNFKYLLLLFILLFVSIVMAKTNEDFGYYHSPNSIQFAQQKLQFGLGNLNHGFKHISSLFMLMSLHYLPFFEHYLFNLSNLLFLVYLVTFILIKIYERDNKTSDFLKLILLFLVILFLTKFSRLAEYGSDLSGQITISIYLFYLIKFTFENSLSFETRLKYLKIAIIFLTFSITLKFISIIYSLPLLLVILISKKKFFYNCLKLKFLLLPIFSISLFLLNNFSSTGCLVYPIEKLCFVDEFNWALDIETIKHLRFHYEIWAKAGLGPNYSTLDQNNYVMNFNWVSNWFTKYFIGKFSDYLLVIALIIIIITLFFYKEIFLSRKNNLNFSKFEISIFLIFYVSFLVILTVWFYNFPTLRYAGYIIVYFTFIFPVSYFLSTKINFSKSITAKKISTLLIISFLVFLFKNIDRINTEFKISELNHHNFKNFPFYWVKKEEFSKTYIDDYPVYITNGSCWNIPAPCIRKSSNLEIIRKKNYIFYKIK